MYLLFLSLDFNLLFQINMMYGYGVMEFWAKEKRLNTQVNLFYYRLHYLVKMSLIVTLLLLPFPVESALVPPLTHMVIYTLGVRFTQYFLTLEGTRCAGTFYGVLALTTPYAQTRAQLQWCALENQQSPVYVVNCPF